jgi:DNA-binding NarL/FixJ family response regulator
MKTALDKELRIIAQSSFFEGDSRSDAIQHFKQEGVTSFLDRWDPGEVILHALRVVARGNTYVSPKIAIAGSTSGACKSLSDLEKRVAKLWARDLAAEEIADKLTTHVQRVTVDMVNVAKKKIKEKLKAAGVIGPGTLSYWLIQERDYGDPPWSKNA